MNGSYAFAPSESENSPIVVGTDGKWFSVGDLRVSLARRKPVARVLWALAQGSAVNPERGAASDDLVAFGWPGERLVRKAARIRLRVAIATLRAMGFGGRILTTGTGYLICGVLSLENQEEREERPSRVSVLLAGRGSESESVETFASIPPPASVPSFEESAPQIERGPAVELESVAEDDGEECQEAPSSSTSTRQAATLCAPAAGFTFRQVAS